MSIWNVSIIGQSYTSRIYHINQIRAPVWLHLICPWNSGRSTRKSHNWIKVNYWSGKWNLCFILKTLTNTLKMGNCSLQLKHLCLTYLCLWWQQSHFKARIFHAFQVSFFVQPELQNSSTSKPVRLFKNCKF